MYSNILLKVAMGVLVLTSIIGCSKEEEPYHEIARIELKGARCLSDSIKKIETFFAGKSTAKEVDAIWTCYSFALRTFDKYVQGENKNSYTSNELRNFLETYFLKEDLKKSRRTHIISDALLDEMMIIKRLFLGGSTNSLKKDELLKTLDLIVVFKKITEDLLPHSKLLFTSGSQTPPSEAEFKAAEQALSKASADLVSFLNQRTSRYEMANLNRLLNELHLFFRDLDPNSKFGKVHIYVPIIAKLKALLLNTNSFAIEASEWPAVGELLSQVAAIGLRAQYTFDVESLYSIEKLDLLERTSRMGLEIVKNSFSYRDHGAIAVSQFLDLIDELEAIDLLPLALTADDAKHMTSRFLDLVLNPEEKYPVSGLTLSKLGYLETEINGWAQVQKLMIRKEENDGNPFWRQMKMVLNSPFSLSLDTLERIVLDGDTAATNIEGATRLNWARAGLSMLFNAYIADPARRKTMNLSTKELHNAFIDLRPIFIGLDLIDKDDFIYDQSLFRDANLFMPRSD
ncbi:MAG: hypothetical protein KDD38_09875, partial [Bdellovibrionales bacterium]|nr:hypothetical protein [Bdellovibrionales bacterium]